MQEMDGPFPLTRLAPLADLSPAGRGEKKMNAARTIKCVILRCD